MRGSKILINPDADGYRTEGTITDTSKPGTCMEKVPATAAIGGRFSWRAKSSAAGLKGPNVVLLENWVAGKIFSDAYAANERCFLYYLETGDDVNMLLGDLAGTSDPAIAIGDLFGTTTTGKIIRNSSYNALPFEANEPYAINTILADIWLWCTYRGDQA